MLFLVLAFSFLTDTCAEITCSYRCRWCFSHFLSQGMRKKMPYSCFPHFKCGKKELDWEIPQCSNLRTCVHFVRLYIYAFFHSYEIEYWFIFNFIFISLNRNSSRLKPVYIVRQMHYNNNIDQVCLSLSADQHLQPQTNLCTCLLWLLIL